MCSIYEKTISCSMEFAHQQKWQTNIGEIYYGPQQFLDGRFACHIPIPWKGRLKSSTVKLVLNA
ncbi:MAG: hypothetical protein EAY75_17660 [Bacteroidetes bacterium]|nr:MAG: hypothetical protein EAY75_17660 [Bacteroidota bacterium]